MLARFLQLTTIGLLLTACIIGAWGFHAGGLGSGWPWPLPS